MALFPKEHYAQVLLQNVATAVADLKRACQADIASSVRKAKDALSAPATTRSHLSRVLAAARRHIEDIEKRVVELASGDEPISRREMARVVRIRLICAELLNIFANALADLKGRQNGNKAWLSGLGG